MNRIFIRVTPQAIWDAITKPEWTLRWGYGLRDEYELRPGGQYRGLANDGMIAMGMSGVIVDGEVIESDPPRRLVITWRWGGLDTDSQRSQVTARERQRNVTLTRHRQRTPTRTRRRHQYQRRARVRNGL